MPIRAVIFDGGGVLVRTTDFSRQRWWEQQLGLAEGSFGAVLWNNPVSLAANVGKASEDEVWTAYQRQFALSDDDVAQLQRDFFAGGEWDERLLGYIRSLKSHYKTGLISNAWPHARKAVQQHVNNTVFDVIVFSAEVGLAKPDRRIYQLALDRLRVQSAEAIFIDDVQENVEAAQAIGMAAIRFENTEQTMTKIERYLNHQG